MPTESNIANEIDAIIAQAMAEYQQARGVEVFSGAASQENIVEGTVTNVAGPNVVVDSIEAFGEEAFSESAEPSVIREEPIHEEIPVNSQSVLVREDTSRFSSAIWFNKIQEKAIILAGVGGIGSYVAFLLSRLHPYTIAIYDDDVVESANMSGQLYNSSSIGIPKVDAIGSLMHNFSGYYEVALFNEKFTANSQASDIMICGFDNMAARSTFFDKWLSRVNVLPEENRGNCLFIDGRLAAESFQVLCIKGDDTYNIDRYSKEYLFSDSEAEETICSYKQTTFMANMIASVMVNLFVNFCANQCNPLVPRDLPFYTEYTAETMYFKVVS